MLSVLIVNWNTRDLLDACLSSLEKHPPREPMEVIVVDNASKDGSAEMVRTKHPTVRLIEPKANTGYARGNNLAMAAARGEWLLTLNPDTEVYADTLQGAITKLWDHPKWGVLGVRQIHTDGATQRSVRGFPTVSGILNDLTGMGKDTYRLRNFNYEVEQAAPQPMGTFLLFRREALEAVAPRETDWKPFDENFPIFFNEVDLLYRLNKAGWPAFYTPDVRILHYGGEGTKQVRKNMIWESHRSLARFLEKHHPSAWLPLLKGLILLGAFIRAKGVHAGFKP